MIISKTPLRASLFGGGSDFRAYFESSSLGYGSVLSVGLDMHVYITVNKKFDDKIRVVYNGNENVDTLDEVKHNIIREALRLVGIEKGIEVIYMADIPMSSAGIGLASSSALAVGVLNALHAYKGEFVPPKQLAEEACYIEIECLGQRIGIQDQYAVAHGGFNRYRFLSDGSVSITPGIINNEIRDSLVKKLMLFFTGNTRDSRNILAEQSDSLEKKRKKLDALVMTVNRVCENIADGDLDCVGEELDRTWQIKKQLAGGISNLNIDLMYETARAHGAIGGKILGAGGGGFMLLYVPENKQDNVRYGLKGYREVPFKIDYQGSRIIFVD
ncbi:GHMP family kinase ATP-binding protein [Selenomonas ruminantium]|uniref:D-glycero-alpha-D-manno-heptose-7-phosphate kinase n=1 Tax=Selenomonas ruminantium TaxID=971 RepID=A0A1H4A9K7_SELRU|nr:GHMP kinase [Selenomonas ruminantium]SEA32607.1 D-glycero-alpha-D-manno-heptose-7-phosphate kinase [Selenomonas ruminantium]